MIALLVLALTSSIVTSCSGGDKNTEAGGSTKSVVPATLSTPTAPPTNPPESSTTIGPSGGTLTSPSTGVRVIVPAGAFISPTKMTVAVTALAVPIDPVLEVAGPIVDVHVDAPPKQPVTIVFPINAPVTPDPVPLGDGVSTPGPAGFFVAHYVGGTWMTEEASLDATAGTLTIQTTTFSPFGIFRMAGKAIVSLAKSIVEEVTQGVVTFVPRPDCGSGTDDAVNWIASPASGPVSWCANKHSDGTRVVQVANRKRYGITVTVGSSLTIKNDGTDLASQLSALISSANQVALAGGETATITIPASVTSTRIVSTYDGLAQALSSLLVAADILSEITAHVPGIKKKSAKEFKDVMTLKSCVIGLGIDISATASNPASTIVKLITKCLGDTLPKALAFVVGGVVATIAGTIAYFMSSGQALFDLIIGGSESTLTLVGMAGPTTTVATKPTTKSAWPIGDNEGTPAFYAYLGASFRFPDWSSCSTNYCIVGSGQTVYLYGTRPKYDSITELGSVALSTPNPREVFINAGVEVAETDAFLKPGPP